MSGYTHSLIQVCEGRYAQAIARLKKLAAYAEDKGMEPRYQCFAYQEIYGAYSKAGNADSTLKYMLLCDAAAGRYNLRHSFLTTLKCLSNFYEKNGDIQKSNAYKSYYLNIMDSIYDSRAFDMVKNSLFTYEVGKTTKEIQDLKTREREKLHTIRKQRIVMWAVAAVALATAVFLAIVLRQRRRLNHSYSDLYKINRDFIVEQKQLTSRLRRDSEILKERDACIAALREQLGKAQAAEPQQAAPQEKYRTSSLTEEQSQALAEAIRNVMENTTEFCNSDFSLASLAELVGTNSKYVSQVINDVFHKSFNDYINPYRIHLACARFADKENYGNFTMKAISESVGFKSYTSFVNIFKKVTGITPSFYFKMAARGNR